MKFDKATEMIEAGNSAQVAPVDPTVVALERMQQQLVEQSRVIQGMGQELAALKAVQAANQVTLDKLERQLRWARWMRRIRSTIFLLFWLGVLAVVFYYWRDLSNLWEDWRRFIL